MIKWKCLFFIAKVWRKLKLSDSIFGWHTWNLRFCWFESQINYFCASISFEPSKSTLYFILILTQTLQPLRVLFFSVFVASSLTWLNARQHEICSTLLHSNPHSLILHVWDFSFVFYVHNVRRRRRAFIFLLNENSLVEHAESWLKLDFWDFDGFYSTLMTRDTTTRRNSADFFSTHSNSLARKKIRCMQFVIDSEWIERSLKFKSSSPVRRRRSQKFNINSVTQFQWASERALLIAKSKENANERKDVIFFPSNSSSLLLKKKYQITSVARESRCSQQVSIVWKLLLTVFIFESFIWVSCSNSIFLKARVVKWIYICATFHSIVGISCCANFSSLFHPLHKFEILLPFYPSYIRIVWAGLVLRLRQISNSN